MTAIAGLTGARAVKEMPAARTKGWSDKASKVGGCIKRVACINTRWQRRRSHTLVHERIYIPRIVKETVLAVGTAKTVVVVVEEYPFKDAVFAPVAAYLYEAAVRGSVNGPKTAFVAALAFSPSAA